jgi:hypothetical protein
MCVQTMPMTQAYQLHHCVVESLLGLIVGLEVNHATVPHGRKCLAIAFTCQGRCPRAVTTRIRDFGARSKKGTARK